ncbi:neurogenic locus notch like protein precursor [Legionella quinlivanii]|uniref:Neurogenic locus notch like protein n=1 Tax=Legionella quinlivanii TaxID=45073 RepID=A0A0W0Y113_9GAMM|nr:MULTISPECIES: hypothetical protein [Legionella]KTD50652.1 neurogenic locus notch like protein precursor [Legionella quinlivanii]MCE3046160.1 neurogenic locus notch [Legionella sp. 16cNR16C]MCW8450257.1 neurogenic locus notch [Legionella quinlivanii]RAP38551.1 hypothetical protein B1207_01320 [Legionella quinlivanii]SEG35558.1 hypothetical protein SAMN02746093_02633 [Legionella quinlivanii DSM 21216]
MYNVSRLVLFTFLLFSLSLAHAGRCLGNTSTACPTCCDQCCGNMGGISYCDSSAGRFVCNNGYYSACYCTRHAIMDLQKIQGCCLWQGGVLKVDDITGAVICNSGQVSESCSLDITQNIVTW